MIDYEVTGVNQSEGQLTHFAFFTDCDPMVFEEAIKEPKWKKSMDEEITSIEKNNT